MTDFEINDRLQELDEILREWANFFDRATRGVMEEKEALIRERLERSRT